VEPLRPRGGIGDGARRLAARRRRGRSGGGSKSRGSASWRRQLRSSANSEHREASETGRACSGSSGTVRRNPERRGAPPRGCSLIPGPDLNSDAAPTVATAAPSAPVGHVPGNESRFRPHRRVTAPVVHPTERALLRPAVARAVRAGRVALGLERPASAPAAAVTCGFRRPGGVWIWMDGVGLAQRRPSRSGALRSAAGSRSRGPAMT